jgi:GMP synthase-like glutamine amidotransferase
LIVEHESGYRVAVTEAAKSVRRGLILSHADEAPAALLIEWLTEHGCDYVIHDVTEAPVPALDGFSFVASLGSVSSATDADSPWVAGEIELLREAIAADVPVLGLCFGGQALSIALGGAVTAAATPQIGWFELSEPVDGVPQGPWFHWHYEQLSVPPGGEPLAHSEAGPAAFRHGRHLGLQFHPEVTVEVIASWSRSEAELAKLGVSPEALREQSEVLAPLARGHAWELFGLWWEGLAL